MKEMLIIHKHALVINNENGAKNYDHAKFLFYPLNAMKFDLLAFVLVQSFLTFTYEYLQENFC